MRSLTRVSVLMGPPSLAAVPGATSLLDPAGIRWEHTQTISKSPAQAGPNADRSRPKPPTLHAEQASEMPVTGPLNLEKV